LPPGSALAIWRRPLPKSSRSEIASLFAPVELPIVIPRSEPLKRNSMPSPRKSVSPGATPRRGEVWWVGLDSTLGSEIKKTRPCLVLSTDVVNQHRRTVVVIPLSTSPETSPPLLVPIECAGRSVVAVVDQIRAIAKERLQKRLDSASADDLKAVEDGLRQILEL
jgi:mRNA interferase MazF